LPLTAKSMSQSILNKLLINTFNCVNINSMSYLSFKLVYNNLFKNIFKSGIIREFRVFAVRQPK
jgi:hypothetical protein